MSLLFHSDESLNIFSLQIVFEALHYMDRSYSDQADQAESK